MKQLSNCDKGTLRDSFFLFLSFPLAGTAGGGGRLINVYLKGICEWLEFFVQGKIQRLGRHLIAIDASTSSIHLSNKPDAQTDPCMIEPIII
jgi:hypothetical protein